MKPTIYCTTNVESLIRLLTILNNTHGPHLQATGYDDGSIIITKNTPQDRNLITTRSTEVCIIETQNDYEVFPQTD